MTVNPIEIKLCILQHLHTHLENISPTWKKNGCKYTLVTGHVHGYKHETTSKSNSAYILCTVLVNYGFQCNFCLEILDVM